MVITSKDNEIIKHIKKLKEKKYRDEYNEFVIEGIKLLEEAISENVNIKQIIICDDCKSQGAIEKDILYDLKENKKDYEDKNFLILDGIQDPRKYRNYIKNCR